MSEMQTLVRVMARTYFVRGLDVEDLEQEARVALLNGIRTYNGSIPFGPYANMVVKRWFATLIKTSQTQSRTPDEPPIPLSRAIFHQEHNEAGVSLPFDERDDPARRVEAGERFRSLVGRIAAMSPLERRAVFGFAAGYSYEEVADGGSVKSVDNAINRARRKLRAA